MNSLLKRDTRTENTTALNELRQYTDDLQRYTLLRDKATSAAERDRYTTIIECMQRAVIHLSAAFEKTLAK